jgi:putative ABC transport system permease protein
MYLFRNYILTLLRNLMKDKLFSFITILGLAIGLFAVIYIVVFLRLQFSFDKHHEKAESIYRVESRYIVNNKPDELAVTQFPIGPTLKAEFEEIENYTRIFPGDAMYFNAIDNKYREDSIIMADSMYFDLFTHEFIFGDKKKALSESFSIVLSESMARKYFPDKNNPVGDSIGTIDGDFYKISAVIKDLPETTHLQFNGIVSLTTWNEQYGPSFLNDTSDLAFWGLSIYTYILLKPGKRITTIESGFQKVYDKYMRKVGEKLHASYEIMFTALPDIRFNNKNLQADVITGDKFYLFVFILIAVIILVIAGINYMNLSTARAINRAKEIGLRKIAGSHRGDLINQFMSESFVYSFFALILALFFVQYTLPFFNQIIPITVKISDIFRPSNFALIILLTIVLGVFSGSLPAYYLSSLSPVNTIKGAVSQTTLPKQIRRLLVIIQFCVASVLIVLLLVVKEQTNLLKTQNLGFNKENVYTIPLQDTALVNNLASFRSKLEESEYVLGTSLSSDNPGYGYRKLVCWVEGKRNTELEKLIISYTIDTDYLDLFEIELLSGRNFRDTPFDEDSSVIISQFTAEKFGWAIERFDGTFDYTGAIGKTIKYGINPETGKRQHTKKVIGVFSDYYFTSLHFEMEPLMLMLHGEASINTYLNIKFDGDFKQEALNYTQTVYQESPTVFPFTGDYILTNISNFYTTEDTLGNLLRYFTLLALIISVLGLVGMTSYMAEQRTKEIAVKKVLGSTAFSLSVKMIYEVTRWVFLANILGWPLAYLISVKWLENFVFAIQLNWTYFASSLLITMFVSIISIAYRVIKVAVINPSYALRYE